jgi:hypothetical protein
MEFTVLLLFWKSESSISGLVRQVDGHVHIKIEGSIRMRLDHERRSKGENSSEASGLRNSDGKMSVCDLQRNVNPSKPDRPKHLLGT